MSSIERLKILGIRSFGPDKNDEATVRFSSPLTLILGQNGCGKTTIIEALKYATCGELPAGTEGGSGFVHDPKLAHVNEIKGHVKLKCRDLKGKNTTVSRTVRVVQKYKKLEFKCLDSTFARDDGESLSGRCVDITAVMCQTLGVSQSVLTNVIFCHQEDSLWPLETGKKVKEKFDAIFGITEYNKCLDYFRALSKEYNAKKALVKKDVDCGSKFWEEAKEKRKKLDNLKAQSAANRDAISEVENQLKPVIDQIKEIVAKEENFASHMSKIKDKKNRKQMILENTAEIKKEIKEEFAGSKEALVKEIEAFETNLKNTKGKLTDLKSKRDDIQVEETNVQKEIDTKTMLMGRLERDDHQHNENVEVRNTRLKNMANELELTVVSSSQMNETNSEEIIKLVEDKISDRRSELKKQQDDQKNLEKSIQSKIDHAREKKATLNQDIRMKQKAIDDNERDVRKVQAEIDEVEKSSQKLRILESDLKDVNEKLEEAVGSLNVNQCKNNIEKANEEIKKLDENSITLDKEVKLLLQISVEKANLDKLVERKKKLEKELASLKDKHRSKFQHLLSSVPDSDFKRKIQNRVDQLNEEIRTHENSINKNERQLSVLNEQKRNLEEQIRIKNRKAAQDADGIDECCGKENIQDYYKRVTDQLQNANDTKGTVSAQQFTFKKYLEKLADIDPMCPLCRREFKSKDEADEVITDINCRLKNMPSQLEQAEMEIRKYSEAQKKAAGLLPIFESVNHVKTVEIPRLKSEVTNINTQIKNLEIELEGHRNGIMGPQTDREMASNVLSDAILMDQHFNELQTLERDIRNLESKLPSIASGKSLQEATDEQETLKTKLMNLRKTLSADQRSLSTYNENVNKLRERKTNLSAEQLKIVGGVQQLKSLQDKLEELVKQQSTLQGELDHAKAQLQPVGDELDESNKTLSQLRSKHEVLLEQKRRSINELEKKIDEIKSLQLTIAEYNRKGGSKKLNETRGFLVEKRLKKDELERRKAQLDSDMETCKQFQSTHELKKFDLDSNLKLRNKKEELSKVEAEIRELEGHVEIHNFDQLIAEKEQLKRKVKTLEQKKTYAEGRQAELTQRIRDVDKELNQPHYKNADDDYRKSVVKLTVTSKAIDDLKLYENAMDWAMIHFHKERMKMINAIVSDLWRDIYKGNDIDKIEIKTDEGTTTAAGRRTYNYRVVQIKNGIELDMPGRCSAGQKVLACLIIRMALAETFSKNCGVLALDEPTTNLDRDNIDSLSEALAKIVERRSAQRNFQLVIITHDEDFLRRLSLGNNVETFIEVSRDDRGRSRVEVRNT